MRIRQRTPLGVFLLLILASNPDFALGASGGESRGPIRNLWQACLRGLGLVGRNAANAPSGKPHSPTLFQSFVRNEAKQIGQLSEGELALVVELSKLSAEDAHILAMLQQYGGPREKLTDLLQWHLNKLAKKQTQTPADVDPVSEWLDLPDCPSCMAVRDRWQRHKEKGWNSAVAPERLSQDSHHSQVFPGDKLIALRRAPSDEPLPLTVAEEVLHIDALDTVEANSAKVNQWVREALGEVVFEDVLKGVDRATRYHWSFESTYHQLLKKLPDADVNKAILFLVERDAMAKKLEIYRELIKTHPEFRTKIWDEIAASQYPIAKMSGILNRQNRFHLNPKFVENLGEHLLDDIVRGRGGETVADREERQAKEKALPVIQMPGRQEAYDATPQFLRKPFGYRSNDDTHWNNLIKELTEDQAQAIVQFLDKPWSAEVAKLGLSDEAYQALYILHYYDQAHGTNHTMKAGVRFLKNLRPDAGDPDKFQYTWSWVFSAVEAGAKADKVTGKIPHPEAIRELLDALQRSPILRDLAKNHNSGTALGRILSQAKSLPPEYRPDPSHILIVVNANVAALEAEAIGSRDYNQFNLRSYAQYPATQARDYFVAIGEKDKAQYLDSVIKRLQDGMDRYRRDDPYK